MMADNKQGTTTMTYSMTYDEIALADIDELTEQLGDAFWEDRDRDILVARETMAMLLVDEQDLCLYDSETNEEIREATVSEAVESATTAVEGHIYVDGRRCYVA
jgi:hypothetical protein